MKHGVQERRPGDFVGVEGAEAHHELCVLDQAGAVLGRRRVPDGVAGLAQLHALVGGHAEEPSQVVVGVELDRGLLVGALTQLATRSWRSTRWRPAATGSATRCQGPSRIPVTPRCWLDDLVRTDGHNHRPVAGDKTVSRWAKEGRLPFLKTLGGHRRYPAAEIRQLADELQVQPTV